MARYFGGLNLIMVGDFWQLPPPGEIAVMGNPYKGAATTSEAAQRVLALFWTRSEESIRKPPIELTINHRQGEDAWYTSVIQQCREGRLSDDDYNFLHGYGTLVPGSTINGICRCGNSSCQALIGQWTKRRKAQDNSEDIDQTMFM